MFNNLYIQKRSIIHSLNFWTKFLCFSLILPLTAFVSVPKVIPLLVTLLLFVLYLSRISYVRFWQLIKIYAISLSIGIIILSLAFSQGPFIDRALQGIVLSTRFILLISFGILFAAVTNPIEIPAGFLQTKIPHKYGITLMVGYRLMPLLSQKIQTIIDAQRARGAKIDLSLQNLPRLPLAISALAIPVLHSTLETSVRLSDALISRGYDPEGKITPLPMRFGPLDLIFISTTLVALVIAVKL